MLWTCDEDMCCGHVLWTCVVDMCCGQCGDKVLERREQNDVKNRVRARVSGLKARLGGRRMEGGSCVVREEGGMIERKIGGKLRRKTNEKMVKIKRRQNAEKVKGDGNDNLTSQ